MVVVVVVFARRRLIDVFSLKCCVWKGKYDVLYYSHLHGWPVVVVCGCVVGGCVVGGGVWLLVVWLVVVCGCVVVGGVVPSALPVTRRENNVHIM